MFSNKSATCGRRAAGRDVVPIEDARSGDPGPVLVLGALKSRGNVYRIDGGMAELDEILEDGRFEIGDARRESIGEIFVARIEPGKDGREHPVPDGYGENGIWVRGEHDYAEPRVAGAIGTGIWSTMIAWVGEATWVERRIAFVDGRRQVAKVRRPGGDRLRRRGQSPAIPGPMSVRTRSSSRSTICP